MENVFLVVPRTFHRPCVKKILVQSFFQRSHELFLQCLFCQTRKKSTLYFGKPLSDDGERFKFLFATKQPHTNHEIFAHWMKLHLSSFFIRKLFNVNLVERLHQNQNAYHEIQHSNYEHHKDVNPESCNSHHCSSSKRILSTYKYQEHYLLS